MSSEAPICLLGIGTSVPPTEYLTSEFCEYTVEAGEYAISKLDPKDPKQKQRIDDIRSNVKWVTNCAKNSKIKKRNCVNTKEFMSDYYKKYDYNPPYTLRAKLWREHCPKLAMKAVRKALEVWGGDKNTITHVVAHSVTGWDVPGLAHHVIYNLELPESARAIPVNYIGCQGGSTILYVAKELAKQNPGGVVLALSAEIQSTLARFYPFVGENKDEDICLDRSIYMPNVLFSDASVCAIIGRPSEEYFKHKDPNFSPFAFGITGSHYIPNTRHVLTISVSDEFGLYYENAIKKELPIHLNKVLVKDFPKWLELCIGKNKNINDIEFAVHPGGLRLLENFFKLIEDLGCKNGKESTIHSYNNLAEYGNLSSCALLFILNDCCFKSKKDDIYFMAMGPGVCLEYGGLHRYNQNNKSLKLKQSNNNKNKSDYSFIYIFIIVALLAFIFSGFTVNDLSNLLYFSEVKSYQILKQNNNKQNINLTKINNNQNTINIDKSPSPWKDINKENSNSNSNSNNNNVQNESLKLLKKIKNNKNIIKKPETIIKSVRNNNIIKPLNTNNNITNAKINRVINNKSNIIKKEIEKEKEKEQNRRIIASNNEKNINNISNNKELNSINFKRKCYICSGIISNLKANTNLLNYITFKNKNSEIIHSLSHNNELLYFCFLDKCEFRASDSLGLIGHFKSVHGIQCKNEKTQKISNENLNTNNSNNWKCPTKLKKILPQKRNHTQMNSTVINENNNGSSSDDNCILPPSKRRKLGNRNILNSNINNNYNGSFNNNNIRHNHSNNSDNNMILPSFKRRKSSIGNSLNSTIDSNINYTNPKHSNILPNSIMYVDYIYMSRINSRMKSHFNINNCDHISVEPQKVIKEKLNSIAQKYNGNWNVISKIRRPKLIKPIHLKHINDFDLLYSNNNTSQYFQIHIFGSEAFSKKMYNSISDISGTVYTPLNEATLIPFPKKNDEIKNKSEPQSINTNSSLKSPLPKSHKNINLNDNNLNNINYNINNHNNNNRKKKSPAKIVEKEAIIQKTSQKSNQTNKANNIVLDNNKTIPVKSNKELLRDRDKDTNRDKTMDRTKYFERDKYERNKYERDRTNDRNKDRNYNTKKYFERDKYDRDRDKDRDRIRYRQNDRYRNRERDRDRNRDKDRSRDRDRDSRYRNTYRDRHRDRDRNRDRTRKRRRRSRIRNRDLSYSSSSDSSDYYRSKPMRYNEYKMMNKNKRSISRDKNRNYSHKSRSKSRSKNKKRNLTPIKPNINHNHTNNNKNNGTIVNLNTNTNTNDNQMNNNKNNDTIINLNTNHLNIPDSPNTIISKSSGIKTHSSKSPINKTPKPIESNINCQIDNNNNNNSNSNNNNTNLNDTFIEPILEELDYSQSPNIVLNNETTEEGEIKSDENNISNFENENENEISLISDNNVSSIHDDSTIIHVTHTPEMTTILPKNQAPFVPTHLSLNENENEINNNCSNTNNSDNNSNNSDNNSNNSDCSDNSNDSDCSSSSNSSDSDDSSENEALISNNPTKKLDMESVFGDFSNECRELTPPKELKIISNKTNKTNNSSESSSDELLWNTVGSDNDNKTTNNFSKFLEN